MYWFHSRKGTIHPIYDINFIFDVYLQLYDEHDQDPSILSSLFIGLEKKV